MDEPKLHSICRLHSDILFSSRTKILQLANYQPSSSVQLVVSEQSTLNAPIVCALRSSAVCFELLAQLSAARSPLQYVGHNTKIR